MALIRRYFFHGLAASLLLGLVFAFLGVYDTNHQPLFKRYVFWSATMVVGTFCTGLVTPLIVNHWLSAQHRFVQLVAIAAIISLPVTLVLAAFDHRLGTDWTLTIWLLQYRYVVVISLILIFGSYFILKAQGLVDRPVADSLAEPRDSDKSNGSKNEDSKSAMSVFLQRLPPSYKAAELYAVSSEDHYLKVYTSLGDELILMRLSDALRELEQVPGMQTHRSWWVAKAAVVERQRQQGKQTLRLKSGLMVPVSRSFDKAVREAELG